MKRKCFLILISVFFLFTHFVNQAQTIEGMDFWLTFGKNAWWHDNTYSLNLQIRIVGSNQPASGVIHFTHLGTSVPFNISPHQVFVYNLNNSQQQAAYNTSQGISNYSIHITTSQPVTVYALNQTYMSTDATNILPVSALGTDYYQISYTRMSYTHVSTTYDALAVVGISNNTKLYFDGILEETIDSGQVYYKTSTDDMTGVHITADNPVALFAVNQGTLIPSPYLDFDCLMQQLAPVNTWGYNYFVPVSHSTRDIIRIVASQNHTTILQTGGVLLLSQGAQTSLEDLQKGEFVELEVSLINKGCYIQADKPIGVCTYLTGFGYNYSTIHTLESDPAQCWLPSLDQTVFEASMTPLFPNGQSTLNKYRALIITATETKDETTVSIGSSPGIALSGGNWLDHSEAGMSFYNMPLQANFSSSYTYSNPTGLIVLCYATGSDRESYYYLANSAMHNSKPAFYINEIYYPHLPNTTFCPGEVTFRAFVPEMNSSSGSLKWYIDDIEEIDARDESEWNKYFTFGVYNIKMIILFSEEDSVILESILHVGYEISATSDPPQGGHIEGVGCYKIDDNVELKAIPNIGYNFVKWVDDYGNVFTEDVLNFTVTEARNLVAHFETKTYSVLFSASPTEGGTVPNDIFDIPHGTSVLIEAFANNFHVFLNWTEDGNIVSLNASDTLDIVKDYNLVAHFTLKTYNIGTSANPIEGGNVTGGGNNILHGTTVSLSATPNAHFNFANWTKDGVQVSIDASYSFVATESCTLVANFKKKTYNVTIDVNNSDYGSSTGAGPYEALSIARVKVFANSCYRFSNWTIDDIVVSTRNPYIFTVTENVNLVANFNALDFDTYCATICDNVFLLNLRKLSEDGYEVSNCKWFKNGIEEKDTRTINEFSYSSGVNELLETTPAYYMYQLTTSNFGNLCSSKKMLTSRDHLWRCSDIENSSNLFVYPNPVLSGNAVTIEGIVKNFPIYIYNHLGACVFTTSAADASMTLIVDFPQGIYLIRSNDNIAKILILK